MSERVFTFMLLAAAGAVLWFGRPQAKDPLIERGPRLLAVAAAGQTHQPEPASAGSSNADPPGEFDRRVSFDRDIRPLLSDRCFQCHGADAAQRQAELRLDDSTSAWGPRENGPALIPGKPDESGVWKHISSHDPDEIMPPPKSTKRPLTKAEQGLVRRWIEQGAAYEPHWSFIPPARPRVPGVQDPAWATNDIDRFIQADLEQHGLALSSPADKSTLLRRLFLDLTGLPPTAEQLSAFLADPAPDAYERWVDRHLKEEPFVSRYAERMASPWLDQARYADTSGIHRDQGRSIWPWRDWVLRAYRDNMPFDQFVKEQLAGDLLPDATTDQQVATGFCRTHVTSDEGGAIEEEYLLEYAVDRVATTGAVFFGLTLGCARCHDHKFDPVTAPDFYSMIAFFNSIEEKGIDAQVRAPDIAFPPSLTIVRPEDQERMDRLRRVMAELQARGDAIASDAGSAAATAEFITQTQIDSGIRWLDTPIMHAESTGGATMTVQPDGSVLASNANPATDEHRFVLHTTSTGVRLLLLEGLRDPANKTLLGRGNNGNVVVTRVRGEAVSTRDASVKQPVTFNWAWASFEQVKDNENYRAANLIAGDSAGWAAGGHYHPGDRALLLLMDEPVGFDGGTDFHLTVEYKSPHGHHVFARTRARLGEISDSGLAMLPTLHSAWYTVGPFAADSSKPVFDQVFGPEATTTLDLSTEFQGQKKWTYEPRIGETGQVAGASTTVGSVYLARQVYAPADRRLSLSVGSDDGIRILANGNEVFRNNVERSLAPDQDAVSFDVGEGVTTVIYKVVNTGGPDGFSHRDVREGAPAGAESVPAFLPEEARSPELMESLALARLRDHSPEYRAVLNDQRQAASELAQTEAALPRTMVMKERSEPRSTFVMSRGRYDQPDESRPVSRAIPAFLGALAADGPRSRLHLAEWMVGPENPLLARVTVNRLWEHFFSSGIVRTTDDFGYQGEYPSHPELLDWLAVEFREKGWNTKGMIRLIVTSSTYRQASRVRPEVSTVDPENRLLSYFPRQRLAAEQLRDQSLFVSGLLVESFGGPSVKPYQPEGLWEEIAMPDSPTRVFTQATGEGLWRRSLYTYWKRAAPPPSMLAFDAPTRESCTVRRISTNTPLQALVLWNDVQFVEAARMLGARTIGAAQDDAARLRWLFLTAASREPSVAEQAALLDGLTQFRTRFEQSPSDAAKLLAVGMAPQPEGVSPSELAAWTMVSNAMLSSDAAIVKR